MSMIYMIFAGMSLAILFIFFYMFARDKEIDKKFGLISASLENINEEIYKLQKQLKQVQAQPQTQDLDKMMQATLTNQIDPIVDNLIQTIKQIEQKNNNEIAKLFDKISSIEASVKSVSIPNLETMKKKDDKERIYELFEIGYSIEEIAKEVGMNAGEVKLILNLGHKKI
ncbi:MAG: DUF2802 domain-containing protein [Epsilonproteobacteria bacterium]|nr:DUF2802 domain-containing protein [Campylobacterota bacterium]